MRLALVTVVPAPYRAPLYDEIDRLLHERGGRLAVIYSGRRRHGVQWPDGTTPAGGVRSIFLNDEPPVFRGRALHANPLVVRALREATPDVVVLGGYAPWIYFAVAWCRFSHVPYLVWSGETPETARAHGDNQRRRMPIWRGAHGFLAYGPAAAEYLASIRDHSQPIVIVGNGIDVDSFARAAEGARSRRDATRARLGLGDRVVLNVGGKNVDVVRAAVAQMSAPPRVVVAGTEDRSLSEYARVLGRLRHDDMPDLYAAADCLAHPSMYDRWPHAINEALAAGLPVVAAPRIGVPDSVLTGPGCSIVEPAPDKIAAALEDALEVGAASTPEVREAIRRPLRPWGVDRMAERFVDAVAAAAR